MQRDQYHHERIVQVASNKEEAKKQGCLQLVFLLETLGTDVYAGNTRKATFRISFCFTSRLTHNAFIDLSCLGCLQLDSLACYHAEPPACAYVLSLRPFQGLTMLSKRGFSMVTS